MADVVIPPAYPAPSPAGYNPVIASPNSFLTMITGELVRDSTPSRTASFLLKSFIL